MCIFISFPSKYSTRFCVFFPPNLGWLSQKCVVSCFQSLLGSVVRLNHFLYRSARRRRSVHVDGRTYLLLFQHVSPSLHHRVKLNLDAARRFGGEWEATENTVLHSSKRSEINVNINLGKLVTSVGRPAYLIFSICGAKPRKKSFSWRLVSVMCGRQVWTVTEQRPGVSWMCVKP